MQIELLRQHIQGNIFTVILPDEKLDFPDHTFPQLLFIRSVKPRSQQPHIIGHTGDGGFIVAAKQDILQHLVQLSMEIQPLWLHAFQHAVHFYQTPDTGGLEPGDHRPLHADIFQG